MSDQVIVAGAALIAFGSFFLGYGLGWGNATAGAIISILKSKRQSAAPRSFVPSAAELRRASAGRDVDTTSLGREILAVAAQE